MRLAGKFRRRPVFTILLPTHNRADVLRCSLQSILAQNFQSYEVLIIADGCTDNSADIVAGFNDKRLKWFDFPKGPGFGYGNRNKALKHAKGDLIALATHDDLYLPDHLSRMAQVFLNSDIKWAYSRPCWIDDNGLCIPFFGNLHSEKELKRFYVRNFIPSSCIVYRRALHEAVGPWPEELDNAGDWVLWKRMLTSFNNEARHIGVERQITQLHFRADWRDEANWGPHPLKKLAQFAEQNENYPHTLRFNLSTDAGLPQEQMVKLLLDKPDDTSHRIRYGADLLQDTLLWEQLIAQH